jgi:hypothetical protein
VEAKEQPHRLIAVSAGSEAARGGVQVAHRWCLRERFNPFVLVQQHFFFSGVSLVAPRSATSSSGCRRHDGSVDDKATGRHTHARTHASTRTHAHMHTQHTQRTDTPRHGELCRQLDKRARPKIRKCCWSSPTQGGQRRRWCALERAGDHIDHRPTPPVSTAPCPQPPRPTTLHRKQAPRTGSGEPPPSFFPSCSRILVACCATRTR